MMGESKTVEEFFARFMQGLRGASHVGETVDGNALIELPLNYADGTPITLAFTEDGRITDDGRTLLRLLQHGSLDGMADWEGIQGYLRIHSMSRDQADLVFAGKQAHDLVRFIEGLRDLELFAPPLRDPTKNFDVAVRRKVREALTKKVKDGKLDEDIEDKITNPKLNFPINIGNQDIPHTVQYQADIDFQSRDGRRFYVILSHAMKAEGDRLNHIKHKLGDVLVARTEGHIDAVFRAVIPPEGYSGHDMDTIMLYSGNEPLRVKADNPKNLVSEILAADGYFKKKAGEKL